MNRSDGDLLRLSISGDEDAFLILYRRHQGPVFRFALHMSGSREIAEEVTQEVFLAMLAGARQFMEELGPLEGYLIGIARNQVRRALKNSRRLALETGGATRDTLGWSPEQFLERLDRDQELAALRSAILSLPPNYREVIVLCDLEGLDYAQAAAHLNCALGTVRSRLHRARSILQAKLRRWERCLA